jgi:hypothetical protein
MTGMGHPNFGSILTRALSSEYLVEMIERNRRQESFSRPLVL